MRGKNLVILIGNLGGDPELKYTASGSPLCKFSLATNESWKDKDGQQQDRTDWHNIVAWGTLGENCGKYLHKGKQVYVEGSIRTRTWDKDDGTKGYMTDVTARQVMFLGGGEREQRPAQQQSGGYGPPDPSENIPF